MLLLGKFLLLGMLIGSIEITNAHEEIYHDCEYGENELGNLPMYDVNASVVERNEAKKRKRENMKKLLSQSTGSDLEEYSEYIQEIQKQRQPKFQLKRLGKFVLGSTKLKDAAKFQMLSVEHDSGISHARINDHPTATISKNNFNPVFHIANFEELDLPENYNNINDLAENGICRYRRLIDPEACLMEFLKESFHEDYESLDAYKFAIDVFASQDQPNPAVCNVLFSVASVNVFTKKICLKNPLEHMCFPDSINKHMVDNELDNTVTLLLKNGIQVHHDLKNFLHRCISFRHETFCGKKRNEWFYFKKTVTYLLTTDHIHLEGVNLDLNAMPENMDQLTAQLTPFHRAVACNNYELVELMFDNKYIDLASRGILRLEALYMINIQLLAEANWPGNPINILSMAVLGGINSIYAINRNWIRMKKTLTKIIAVLIEADEPIEAVDVMYFAVKYCDLSVVKLLYEHGAQANYQNLRELIPEEEENMKYLKAANFQ